jgi:uncharacterized protein
MWGKHRWALNLSTSIGVLGLAATSGLVVLAHHFVDELSRPHALPDETLFEWKVPDPSPEPPASYRRSLTFYTSDGTFLRGEFWAQPRPAPTVIMCHGYRITRSYLYPVAALQYKLGYNVLLFDFRGHGESESKATTGGNAEVRDLQAALMAASQQTETIPGKIIIYGFSMGAAVALLTPPHPQVAAIIVDSPYARSDEVLRRFVHWHLMMATSSRPSLRRVRHAFPALAWATVATSTIVFRLRYGHAMVARPDASFKRWKALSKTALRPDYTPILLIHDEKDPLIPITHAHQIVAKARTYNIPVETYYVDHAVHCGAYGYNPEQYVMVIQEFLARHLGDDFPRVSGA